MILDDRSASLGIGSRATLDDLFRRAAQRRPDALALIDPPNRDSFTDDLPRRLTYAQADRMISAIAGRLARMGLRGDFIVALQIANTIESVLTLLGVLRAGLIAMPLPLLWRRSEMVEALGRVGAQALLVGGRIGASNHFDLAMHVAAEVFCIRHVGGFGCDPPDGVIAFDDLFASATIDPLPQLDRSRPPGPAAHLAVITWDVSLAGLVPVARSHSELMAAGLSVLLESRLTDNAVVLTTVPISSFAGITCSLMPWLLAGGTLALHQPFDATAFATQRNDHRCDLVVVPGPLVPQLTEAGLLSLDSRTRVLALWRAPEQLARAAAWQEAGMLIDVQAFGEIGLIAGRREADGRPAQIPFGPLQSPRGAGGALFLGEITATDRGTVALRGPMVPWRAFPPGAEQTLLPHLKVAESGYADTGYSCAPPTVAAALLVTAPPPGIVSVGGYRFALRELEALVQCAGGGTIMAVPDTLSGHRLAGTAADRGSIQQTLAAFGVNPLVIGAFEERGAGSGGQTGERRRTDGDQRQPRLTA